MSIQQMLVAQPAAGGGAVAAKYWRLYCTVNQASGGSGGSGGYVSFAEMQLRSTVGGSNIATGGTAIGSTFYSGYPYSNAFDGNPATNWASDNGGVMPAWCGYQLASAVLVKEIAIQADPSAYGTLNENPADFLLQYSTNGTTWVTVKTLTGLTWTYGEIKVFNGW